MPGSRRHLTEIPAAATPPSGLIAMTASQQAMSDSGSRMEVVTCREMRPGAVIVAIPLPLSCRNFLQQLLHQLVRYVVVLDVAGSNPVAHPILYSR